MISPKWIFVFALLVGGEAAWAVKEVGNGGDAVMCTTRSGRVTARLYDHYESEAAFARVLDFGGRGLSVDQKLDLMFKRIERLNPNRAALYREWYKTFWQETDLRPGVDLIDIPDTGAGFVPSGCTIAQAAVQSDPHFPGSKRYLISKKIWDLFDRDSQAGLILHELILREATHLYPAHENSRATRYLNGYFSSKEIETFSLKPYLELLKLAGFNWGDAHGVPIRIDEISFRSDDEVESAMGYSGVPFTYAWRGQMLPLRSPVSVRFRPGGELQNFEFAKAFTVTINQKTYELQAGAGMLRDEQGKVTEVSRSTLDIPSYGGVCGHVHFDAGELPILCRPDNLVDVKGTLKFMGQDLDVTSAEKIVFDPTGLVIGFGRVTTDLRLNAGGFSGEAKYLTLQNGEFRAGAAKGTLTVNGQTQMDFTEGELVYNFPALTLRSIGGRVGDSVQVRSPEFTGECQMLTSSDAKSFSCQIGDGSPGGAVVGRVGSVAYRSRGGLASLNWSTGNFRIEIQRDHLSLQKSPNFELTCGSFGSYVDNSRDEFRCTGAKGWAMIKGVRATLTGQEFNSDLKGENGR